MASYQYIYVMKNLSKTFSGGREILKDITLSFLPGVKIGVLGPNGAGKSTLMKIMAGQDEEYNGEAWAADGVTTGYLEQEPQLEAGKTVKEIVEQGCAEVVSALKEYDEIKREEHFIKSQTLIDIIDNIERLVRALRKHIIRK